MGASYRQFCPMAKAMELLDERWTLLLVRELLLGSERFSDLRRGLPRMSPTLLSRRLHQLVAAGALTRDDSGGEVRYRLTPAGQELRPVVEALAVWGTRWIPELADEELDPKLLVWDMHRNIDRTHVPLGRSVVRFDFSDVEPKVAHWWIVITTDDVDVCDVDPGDEPTAVVRTSLRSLTEVWRGDRTWAHAHRAGTLDVLGTRDVQGSLAEWFTLSPFAGIPRPVSS
ncbi:transcriptional regulator, HxlR family [Nocardioides alpinus]|uniref:Transcriptional regulator n=1 Tax=Nocardioides alpinus TaxID=748909 RepID=A0A1I0XVM9_9ACTN|nr:helix-turn-helix domain-containing protein [Nocardioides alpinus]PKH42813.1 transcriptional regulator [Nocardioides alpinus]SFB05105.1 transcriptional regulator, HxlR family [Nocardioides alpinus]